MTARRRLVIVQPYVPAYRLEFFSRLVSSLADDGIECVVAAGHPTGAQLARGDSADAPWIVRTRTRAIRFAGKQLTLGGSRKVWKGADAVIVGHLGSSLDTYLALWDSVRNKRRTGLWGHIKSYVNDPHGIDAALEGWQLRHADHVFAYTPGGADFAAESGVVAHRITTVMNAVDTDALRRAVESLSDEDVEAFGRLHGLHHGNVLAFVGGFDPSKRIDFLVDSLDALWELRPDVRVLVGGLGDQASAFDAATLRGQIVRLGYVDDRDKALIGRWATAILMPGRIGLVAVEALAIGVPVVSTNWPYHAPEAEYLRMGVSRFDAPDEPQGFAAFVADFLSSPPPKRGIGEFPTLDGMVERFRQGALKLVG